MPTPQKRNHKATIITAVFGVVMLGIILYETVGLRQVECEVCMEFEGRRKCLLVKAESE